MKYVIILMLLACTTYGQKHFDKTYDSASIQNVLIDNFKGDIIVKPGKAQSIRIVADQQNEMTANTLKLKEFRKDGVIAVYLDNPCKKDQDRFDLENPFSFLRSENDCNWGHDMEDIPDLNFTIEIPSHLNVYVSTIMDGEIEISDMNGIVYASNVNGSIKMQGVSQVKNATTVNGDIDILYNNNPSVAGKFSTINGEINLDLPPDASLTTKFKSYMGELYTDLDDVEMLNSEEDADQVKAGGMMKIKEYSHARIGNGEVSMIIETFNGNAYLKKHKQ